MLLIFSLIQCIILMYIKLLLLITLIDILFMNRFIINIFLVEVVG